MEHKIMQCKQYLARYGFRNLFTTSEIELFLLKGMSFGDVFDAAVEKYKGE